MAGVAQLVEEDGARRDDVSRPDGLARSTTKSHRRRLQLVEEDGLAARARVADALIGQACERTRVLLAARDTGAPAPNAATARGSSRGRGRRPSERRVVDLGQCTRTVFFMPAQWVASCLRWTAGEKCAVSLQARMCSRTRGPRAAAA